LSSFGGKGLLAAWSLIYGFLLMVCSEVNKLDA